MTIDQNKAAATSLQTKADDAKASEEEKAKALEGLKASDSITESLLKEHPGDPQVQLAGGGYFTERKDFERAIGAYDQGLAQGTVGGSAEVTVKLLNGKAGARYAQGDLAGALEGCSSALDLQKGEFTATAICESVLSKLRAMGIEAGSRGVGKNMKSLRERVAALGEKALREGILPPAGERQAQALAWANQGTRKAPRTAEQWAKLQESAPGPAFGALFESMKARRSGNLTLALSRAEEAVRTDPGEPMAWVERGLAKNALKDSAGVIVDLSEAIRLGWKDREIFKLRADALFRRGSPPELRAAHEDLNQALILEPKDAWAHYARGAIRAKLGYPRELFLEELKRAAELDPGRYGEEYKNAQNRDKSELGSATAKVSDLAPEPAGLPGTPFAMRRWSWLLAALGALVLPAWAFVAKRASEKVPAIAVSPDALAGRTIKERFKILRLLGQGGMGTVYEAADRDLGRKVALKAIFPEPGEDPQALLKEARTVAGLKHPNIIDIHDAFLNDGVVFQVYELVEGDTIFDLIAQRGRVPEEECFKILQPVCAALDFAHASGVVHRDLKPSNIMIDKDGVVKVLDFGLARATARVDAGTMTENVMGTPVYMAPEAHSGALSRQSDLFSLGVTCYEMLTGRRPFQGPALTSDKWEGRIPALPELAANAPRWEVFFKKALAPNPQERFTSAAEFSAAAAAARTA